jgi:hypothetical protein
MATTETQPARTAAGYELHGTLLEACSCGVLCPCWVGEDPDEGTCRAFIAYKLDEGSNIRGIDVSGLSYVGVADIPGNVLNPGTWKVAAFIDDRASDEQAEAMLDAFTGKLGGPLADLAALVGEVVGVERTAISHAIDDGAGTLTVGDGAVYSEMTPYRSADGTTTTLRDSVFSTVPGSPAWVGKAAKHTVNLPQYGMEWSFEDRNAIQSDWHIKHG